MFWEKLLTVVPLNSTSIFKRTTYPSHFSEAIAIVMLQACYMLLKLHWCQLSHLLTMTMIIYVLHLAYSLLFEISYHTLPNHPTTLCYLPGFQKARHTRLALYPVASTSICKQFTIHTVQRLWENASHERIGRGGECSDEHGEN